MGGGADSTGCEGSPPRGGLFAAPVASRPARKPWLALSLRSRADVLRGAASLAALVGLWALASHFVGDPLRAPGPGLVLPRLWDGIVGGAMLPDLRATLGRVALSFALAMGAGVALGLALGLWRRADRWFDPWLTVALNVPALVTIVLCYLWIGLNETAAIAAVALNKIPLVAVMLREGVRVLDPGLSEMSRVHRMGRIARLRHIILPQLAPHLMAAARSGISLIWKIVLVVEFLGRSNGIGFRLHLDFQMFDIAGVIAHALAFIAVMLCVEWLVLAPLSRRVAAWRQT